MSKKRTPRLLLAAWFVTCLPLWCNAQTPGTYNLIAAGTSGGEKGYCSVGTVSIKADKTVEVKTKSPLEPGSAPTYSGKAISNPFTVFGPNKQKLTLRMAYRGDKYIYGTYTAYKGAVVAGAGEYSMTRR